jgi:hypothetical protein
MSLLNSEAPSGVRSRRRGLMLMVLAHNIMMLLLPLELIQRITFSTEPF